MDTKNKESVGLFRLEDLESMKTEDQGLFPAVETKKSDEARSVTSSTDQMVALIRKVRSEKDGGAALDEVSDGSKPSAATASSGEAGSSGTAGAAPTGGGGAGAATAAPAAINMPRSMRGEVAGSSDLAQVLSSGQTHGRRFDTSEMRAVLNAAEAENARRKRFKRVLVYFIALPFVLGLIGLGVGLLVTMPPSMLDAEFTVQPTAVVVWTSDLEQYQLNLIPPPAPTPVTEGDDAQQPHERNRDRRDRRDRNRERNSGAGDLF